VPFDAQGTDRTLEDRTWPTFSPEDPTIRANLERERSKGSNGVRGGDDDDCRIPMCRRAPQA
jgi:hypothetical protein